MDQASEDAYGRVIERVDPVAVIVTCAAGADKAGCLVTFSAPCSLEPPRYAVWLSHRNHTYRVALEADELIVHMLTHADLPLAELFGGVSGVREDKFARVPWNDHGGTPLLRVSGGWLAGRILSRVPGQAEMGGDHTCFVLEPTAARAGEGGSGGPLRASDVRHIQPGQPGGELPRGPGGRRCSVVVMALTTSYTQLVGCRIPIQQAPMGSVSTAALAVAVAEAGGVGSITALGLSAARLDKLLAGMAAQTNGALAANFLTADIDREAVEAAAARVRIVDFFWADPDRELVELVHRNGALACWQVGSRDEARAAADAGCDVLVVQGIEAGGHIRGQEPLLPLLESVLGQLDVPVLAAGGIGDGRAFAAMLGKGAAGARVGTRFVATHESGAHPAYKQAVADAVADSTEITGAFAICPLCATVPRARVLRACVRALRDVAGDTVGEATLGGRPVSLPKGHGLPPGPSASGHIDAMPMYAGQSAAAIQAVEPAAAVIQSWCAVAEGSLHPGRKARGATEPMLRPGGQALCWPACGPSPTALLVKPSPELGAGAGTP